MRPKFAVYSLIICLTFVSNVFAESITISDAWIRETPKYAPTSAMFAKLTNHSHKAIALTRVSSPISNRIELHKTIHENGMMKMRKQSLINIAAKSTLELKTMSWHIMIFSPNRTLRKGRKVKMHLYFSDNSRQTLNVRVKSEHDKPMKSMQH